MIRLPVIPLFAPPVLQPPADDILDHRKRGPVWEFEDETTMPGGT